MLPWGQESLLRGQLGFVLLKLYLKFRFVILSETLEKDRGGRILFGTVFTGARTETNTNPLLQTVYRLPRAPDSFSLFLFFFFFLFWRGLKNTGIDRIGFLLKDRWSRGTCVIEDLGVTNPLFSFQRQGVDT